MQRQSTAVTFVRALGRIAEASAAAALSQQGAPKRKRRRKKAEDDCDPCAAMQMVEDAKERISEGKL